jgi:hypothetical protein
MIDSIEHNVSKAKAYVEVAAGDVKTVEQYDKKIKKVIHLISIQTIINIYFFYSYRKKFLF